MRRRRLLYLWFFKARNQRAHMLLYEITSHDECNSKVRSGYMGNHSFLTT